LFYKNNKNIYFKNYLTLIAELFFLLYFFHYFPSNAKKIINLNWDLGSAIINSITNSSIILYKITVNHLFEKTIRKPFKFKVTSMYLL